MVTLSPFSKLIVSSFIVVLTAGWALPVLGQATGADVLERRAELESELVKLEAEIERQREILREQQRKTVSLERDVAILDAQIEAAELSIRQRDLVIRRLSSDINGKEATIGDLSAKLEREKDSLAELIRKTHELDSVTVVEVVFANQNVSDFFHDLDAFASINRSLHASFQEIESTKQTTKRERDTLAEKRTEEQELRQIQELQKRRIVEGKAEKKRLLDITKGHEEIYARVVAATERDAAVIRSELFQLRGSDAIPFERALELANFASQKTGIRTALILGVIAEESNLGENVGTGNWKTDMHPTRDRPIFEEITRRLGFDPDRMPVSAKPWYGWGGAMGPAQFIPSTWVLVEKQVASIAGVEIANPWDPKHAFLAAALLLKDNGAGKGTYDAERLAALRYFAGWNNAKKAAYAFYGDDVMGLATKYQKQIDILAGS
ncbi:MAG: hypothetical protein HY455_02845 [Parcubacteria group bacterium]|nr:hypothetical protein [Parcubacteria group bacterium]